MKRVLILIGCSGCMLHGMSAQEFAEAQQERRARIDSLWQLLSEKQDERNNLLTQARDAEVKLNRLTSALAQERGVYEQECKRLHEDIARCDSAVLLTRLADAYRAKEREGSNALVRADTLHDECALAAERQRKMHAQKKEKCEEAIDELKEKMAANNEDMRAMSACLALFVCSSSADSATTLYEAPPAYDTVSRCGK